MKETAFPPARVGPGSASILGVRFLRGPDCSNLSLKSRDMGWRTRIFVGQADWLMRIELGGRIGMDKEKAVTGTDAKKACWSANWDNSSAGKTSASWAS